MNSDGTGVQRLFSDNAYSAVGGRLQTGGTRDPSFSPDGTKVVVTHGLSIAVVDTTGQDAVTVANSFIKSSAVRFRENDPVYTSSGNRIVMSSYVKAKESKIPPAIAVIEMRSLSLQSPEEEKK